MSNNENILVFVGTYNNNIALIKEGRLNQKAQGIYVFRMDPETGELILLSKGNGEPNPSYLTLDQTKKYLYSTNEITEYNELKSGAVTAFSINPKSGELSFLNRLATGGTDPCYLTINNSNTHLLVTNYSSGSVSLFPLSSDGFLEPISCFIQHKGKSINTDRQSGPHAHAIELDKKNKHAFVTDLGCDKVFIYKTDFENGCLTTSDPAFIKIKAGEGPRHCIFHPAGKYFYIITEMGSSICSYLFDEAKGTLALLQVISTLPKQYVGQKWSAAIKILPNGNFLYASNRGHDSIATYKINNDTGKLTLVTIQSTGGSTPRDFDFDPEGNYLIAANQTSNNIVVFKINRENGYINEVFRVNNILSPTCIKVCSLD